MFREIFRVMLAAFILTKVKEEEPSLSKLLIKLFIVFCFLAFCAMLLVTVGWMILSAIVPQLAPK